MFLNWVFFFFFGLLFSSVFVFSNYDKKYKDRSVESRHVDSSNVSSSITAKHLTVPVDTGRVERKSPPRAASSTKHATTPIRADLTTSTDSGVKLHHMESSLPPGWSVAVSPEGVLYYVNADTGVSSFMSFYFDYFSIRYIV